MKPQLKNIWIIPYLHARIHEILWLIGRIPVNNCSYAEDKFIYIAIITIAKLVWIIVSFPGIGRDVTGANYK
jgi:hypothetical protein